MPEPTYVPILEKMIGFPTVSSAPNLDLIDYIETKLQAVGCHTRRTWNEDRTKANLLARMGPDREGGLMLAGHTDVVPITGGWHTGPFTLQRDGDRLIGRGTSDMKGFLALVLDVVGNLNPARLKRPLHMVFTYDEEVGCLGARELVSVFQGWRHLPRLALIGEPTGMKLVDGHKSIRLMETEIRGRAAHSSSPQLGLNAIEMAAQLICRLNEVLPGATDARFTPPQATLNVGRIQGGAAVNIIADQCQFQWEYRALPGQDPAVVLSKLQALTAEIESRHPGLRIIHRPGNEVPGLKGNASQTAVNLVLASEPDLDRGTAPFVTEAGLFEQAGIPTLVCGPGRLDQAHQPNEFVETGAMARCRNLLLKLLKTLD